MKKAIPLPAVPLLISFLVGICLYVYFPHSVSYFGYSLMIVGWIALFLLSKWPIAIPQIPIYRMVLLLLNIVGMAYLITSLHDDQNNDRFIGNHLPQAQHLVAVIQEAPIDKPKTILLPVQVVAYRTNTDSMIPCFGKAQIYVYKQADVAQFRAGDTIIIPNQLQNISHSNNPFAFNYAKYASYQQLYYQGFYAYKDFIYVSNSVNTAQGILNQWRNKGIALIKNSIRDTTTLSISLAMLLNERALLHEDIWKTYANTGIIHIISISGMHIQIFLGILLLALSWIKNNKYRWIKYVIAAAIVWIYIGMTLYPASAVRAGIMFSITALALLINKEENPINSLAVAALVMLCYEPFWLFNMGMQLSFLCMLSIYLFFKPIKNLLYVKHKYLRYLWEGVAMSMAVQILVAPLVIYYFHQFPLFVFIVNIPAAIYSACIMWGNLLIVLLSEFIPMLWLGDLLAWLTHHFNQLVSFFARYTPSIMSNFALDRLDALLMTMLLTAWASYFLFRKTNRVLFVSSLLSFLFCISALVPKAYSFHQERLVVYQKSRTSVTQVVKGTNHYVYTIDSSIDYSQLLAFPILHWNLKNTPQTLASASVFKILNYTGLVLDAPISDTLNIDILILTQNTNYTLLQLEAQFQPKLIVLDGSFPRWKAQKWVKENELLQTPVHSVTLNGAFVFPQ